MSAPTIAVLHGLSATSRHAAVDHVLSFERYLPQARILYHHLYQPPSRLHDLGEVDLVVINWCFLARRKPEQWAPQRERYAMLREFDAPIVAVPQDDYKSHMVLDGWLSEIGVDAVWSPIEANLDVLYPRTITSAVFKRQLTGYVDPGRVSAVQHYVKPLRERPIDVGQRVRFALPNLGRHAQNKGRQAVELRRRLQDSGLAVDISTNAADSFHGDGWFRFLSSCRFTVGSKGGASIPDPDGSIAACTKAYLSRSPDASFEEVEAACFPGLDGRHVFAAVGPRLFDAAAVRTCQILAPDDYLGVLEPWVHYVPLEEDFSNLEEVVEAIRDVGRAQEIADACYEALVASGRFTYARFAEDVAAPYLGDTSKASAADSAVRVTDGLTETLMELPRRTGVESYEMIRQMLDIIREKEALTGFCEALALAAVNREESPVPALLDAVPALGALDDLAAPAAELAAAVARLGATDDVLRWVSTATDSVWDVTVLSRWIDPSVWSQRPAVIVR
jgi:hypothetical protein